MKRFITSNDIMALTRAGKVEVVLDDDDRLTDLAKETVRSRGLKIVKASPGQAEQETAEQETTVPSVPIQEAPSPPILQAPKPVYDLLIKNGTLVLPEMGCVKLNICVRNGKIASLTSEAPRAVQEIDAKGLYVLPGIIDPHTHLGLFAPLEEEIVTETRSALLGGVTTIGTFFNHEGSYLPTIRMLEKLVPERSRVDMMPHFTLRDEAHLQELPHCSALGMNSFKVYMCGIPGLFPHQQDAFIVDAMERLRKLNANPILCVHAENASLCEGASQNLDNLSVQSLEQWAETHPNMAEGEAVIRTSYFAKKTGVRTYIVHTSCKESMEELRHVKHEKLFVETTSPYLTLDTHCDAAVYGKMLPPFREPESRQALWDGIREGIIDTIGTDNTTIRSDEKKVADGMLEAVAGYPALGTHLVSVLNEGVCKQGFSLEKIIPLMTMNPARIFGIYPQKGTLIPGADADIVLVDLNKKRIVTPGELCSRSDFSIYQGMELQGWPQATIKAGHIMAWNGKLTDDTPTGRVLRHCTKECD